MNTCLEGVQRDADSQAFWTLCEMEGVCFTLSLHLSFFTIYLMSGQCCVCSRREGRWIPAVLTMLSPHLVGLSLWWEHNWARASLRHPKNWGRLPSSALVQSACQGRATHGPLSLETLVGQLPKRGTDGNTGMNQTGVFPWMTVAWLWQQLRVLSQPEEHPLARGKEAFCGSAKPTHARCWGPYS